MQYSIFIDQVCALQWGINLQQAAVFNYFQSLGTWAEHKEIDGNLFYFVSRTKVATEHPLISDKPDTIYRIYKALALAQVIDWRKVDGKDYIRVTKKGSDWNNSEKNPNVDLSQLGKKSESTRKKIRIHSEKNPTYQYTSDYTTNNQETNIVESHNSTVVVYDQIDETVLKVYDELDATTEQVLKEEKSKKKKAAAPKNPDPTPIDAMWKIILEQSEAIKNPEPIFQKRYSRDFKELYIILKQRAEKRQEPITDQVEPFRRYVAKIVDYIIKGRKVAQHQFTANNLARNFNPGYLHNSFNQICATISGGVSGVSLNGKQQPAVYNEAQVYHNYDHSKAAF